MPVSDLDNNQLHNTHWPTRRTQLRRQQKTGWAFLLSLFLHAVFVCLIVVTRPLKYEQNRQQDLLNRIEVDIYHPRFHVARPQYHAQLPIAQRHQKQAKNRLSFSSRTKVKKLPVIKKHQSEKAHVHPTLPLLQLKTETILNNSAESILGDDLSVNQLNPNQPNPKRLSRRPVDIQHPKMTRGFAQPLVDAPSEQNTDTKIKLSKSEQIGKAMVKIAQSVVNQRSKQPTDIVLLLDASGSMKDNIIAVSQHLKSMVSVFEDETIDFTIGVVTFKYQALIFGQTTDYHRFERLLRNVDCGGLERPYHAIIKSINQVKFRSQVNKRFILVTDEPIQDHNRAETQDLPAVLRHCLNNSVVVDVIGLNEKYSKYLAEKTAGLWFPIPTN